MRTHKKSPDAPLPLQQTRQAGRMPVASLHETTGMIPAAPGRSGAQPLTRLPRQIPLPDGSLEAAQRRPQ